MNPSGTGDEFGTALAAGDFDRDGAADLAVGVPGEDILRDGASQINAGQVQIFYGQAGSGLGINRTQVFNQDTPIIASLTGTNEHFGKTLVSGNFQEGTATGDDLVIGVPFEGVAPANRGMAHVLYGTAGIGLTAVSNHTIQQSSSYAEAMEMDDRLPTALAVGHFDGAHDDLIVGVGAEDLELMPTRVNVGIVHVIHGGTAAGIQTSGNRVWSQETMYVLDTAE